MNRKNGGMRSSMESKDVFPTIVLALYLNCLFWFEEVQVLCVNAELITTDPLNLMLISRDDWSQGADSCQITMKLTNFG